ncbi:MAG: DUF1924 domain-containing protein [Burkholderiales bacterium]|nr:DUF1924 domain-containing protein [Burkholderiales bacterium]
MKTLPILFLLLMAGSGWAETPQSMLKNFEANAGPASVQRGEQFFNSRHGREWSCASCHTSRPDKVTEHIVTGKPIQPLAPAANAARFTDLAKSEKWFKRNCKDVASRECSTQEKADILAWLMSIK